MTEPDPATHARSFGAAADAYERGRPTYPAEVAAWFVPEDARLAVDVGAGTGKFTRTLLGQATEVVAVEPDGAMRERLGAALPEVRTLEGTAESIPLDDGSADAVTLAQAWHWVDPVAASAEIGRVLRPGGTLGLVWNMRDEDVPWVAELGRIITRPETHLESGRSPVVAAPFDQPELRTLRWVDEQSRDAVLDLVASRSYIIVLPEAERRGVLDAVRRLLDTAPELAGRETIPMPYVTYAHRSVRP
jgi:SAM-dependent methyltransferase